MGLGEHLSLTPRREGGEGGGMWGAVSGADGARGPRVALSHLTSLTGPGESGEMPVAKMCVAKKNQKDLWYDCFGCSADESSWAVKSMPALVFLNFIRLK